MAKTVFNSNGLGFPLPKNAYYREVINSMWVSLVFFAEEKEREGGGGERGREIGKREREGGRDRQTDRQTD